MALFPISFARPCPATCTAWDVGQRLLWLDKDSRKKYNELFTDLVATGEPLTDQIIAIAEAEQEKKRLQKQRDKEVKGTSSKSSASSSKH